MMMRDKEEKQIYIVFNINAHMIVDKNQYRRFFLFTLYRRYFGKELKLSKASF